MDFIAEFEKVSYSQFLNDTENLFPELSLAEIETGYANLLLPLRASADSAGYDFFLPFDITLKKDEITIIPSGIRVRINSGFVLEIYPRSSLGIKKNIILANTVGIIDADYYGAINEGHILIALNNKGKEDLKLNRHDRLVQGIFKAYYLAVETSNNKKRIGGIGSSGK